MGRSLVHFASRRHGALSFDVTSHGAWLSDHTLPFSLPALFFNVDYRAAAVAAAFTGFITTAGNRVGETMALGKLSSSELPELPTAFITVEQTLPNSSMPSINNENI